MYLCMNIKRGENMLDNYPIGVTNDDWQESVTECEEEDVDGIVEEIILGLRNKEGDYIDE